jgi:hypothetical protein
MEVDCWRGFRGGGSHGTGPLGGGLIDGAPWRKSNWVSIG